MARNLSAALLFLVLCPVCPAQGAGDLTLSADKQHSFAQQLFLTGQYQKAAVEFQRFAFLFDTDPRAREAMYLAGDALFKSRDHEAALQVLQGLVKDTVLDAVAVKAYFLMAECHLSRGAPSQALVQLHNLIALSEDAGVRDRAYFRMGWIHVEQTDWSAARRAFTRVGPDSDLPSARIVETLDRTDAIPRKSPTLAGTLSIVPGAGQMYCGRYQDALAAFLVNAALIWAAVDAFDDEQYALGGLLSFMGAGFYAGNIYGAISGAHKYNEQKQQDFIEGLKQSVRLSLQPVAPGGARGVILGVQLRF